MYSVKGPGVKVGEPEAQTLPQSLPCFSDSSSTPSACIVSLYRPLRDASEAGEVRLLAEGTSERSVEEAAAHERCERCGTWGVGCCTCKGAGVQGVTRVKRVVGW